MEDRMKKIFFIINCYSKGGGAEALLTDIVNNLNPQKYEIGVMEIIHDDIKEEPVNSNVKIYPYYVKANDPERKKKMYYVYREWDKVIKEYIPQDYDLYVSFNYLKPSFLLPPGKKNIAWIHTDIYDIATEDKTEEREMQARAFEKANRIIAICDYTKQSIEDLFPEQSDKVQVIYNGTDVEKVRKLAKEKTDIKLQHPAIINIGRLEDRKNPIRQLEIFDTVYKRNPNIHLYYLGYGDLDKIIEKMAIEKGLQENVHLLGYHENPFPIVQQADITCMTSKAEGWGLVLSESLSLGIPIVSTDVGGARILSNEGKCGVVFNTNEEAEEGIIKLLQKNREELKDECKKIAERFNLKNYICQIEKLFDEVLES